MPQALGARQDAGVGHGVGGAREQIRYSDRLTQRAGQDPEREVKAPADLPQHIVERVRTALGGHVAAPLTRNRRVSVAGRGNPSPS